MSASTLSIYGFACFIAGALVFVAAFFRYRNVCGAFDWPAIAFVFISYGLSIGGIMTGTIALGIAIGEAL